MVILALRLVVRIQRANPLLNDVKHIIPLCLLLTLCPQEPLATLAKWIRHLISVDLKFQYLLLIKHVLNEHLSMRLQRNSPVALEVLPDCLGLVVVVDGSCIGRVLLLIHHDVEFADIAVR